MRSVKFYLLALLVVSIVSCQKGIDWSTPTGSGGTGGSGGSGGGSGTLLVKIVAITGADTMTTLYTYDSQKRLETDLMEGKTGGMYNKSYRKLFRDNDDRIIQIKQKIDQNGISSDTSITNYYYPSATSKEYSYSIMETGLMGLTTVDSTRYTYSGNNMVKNDHFMSSYLMGIQIAPPSLSQRFEFTYDGSGKVTEMKGYSSPPGTPGQPIELLATYTHTYGSLSIAGYYTSNAAQNYATGGMPTANHAFLSKTVIVSPTVPQANMTMNYAFVLGSNGMPSTSTLTKIPANEVTKYTYYYQ
jgi:hypothetical protein